MSLGMVHLYTIIDRNQGLRSLAKRIIRKLPTSTSEYLVQKALKFRTDTLLQPSTHVDVLQSVTTLPPISRKQDSVQDYYFKNEWQIGDFVRFEVPYNNARFDKPRPTIENETVTFLVRTRFERPIMLKRTIDSIINQDLDGFPVSIKILLLYDKKYDSVALERRPAIQQSKTRLDHNQLQYIPCDDGHRSNLLNVGLTLSEDGFINILDDDDFLYPSHVIDLLSALKETGRGAAYSAADVIYSDGGGDESKESYSGLVHYALWWSRDKLLRQNLFPIQAVLFHKRDVKTLKFDTELDALEDWHFWIQLTEMVPFIGIPSRTSAYRTPMPGTDFWKARINHHTDHIDAFNSKRLIHVSSKLSEQELKSLELMNGLFGAL